LDSYSIQGLYNVSADDFHTRFKYKLPRNATMGFIADESVYSWFQAEISQVCAQANVPRIAYDIGTWDAGH